MQKKTLSFIMAVLTAGVIGATPLFAENLAQRDMANNAQTAEAAETVQPADAAQNDKADAAKEENIATGESEQTEMNEGNLFTTVKQGGLLMIFLILLGLGALTIIIERMIFFTRNHTWKTMKLEELLSETARTSDARFREQLEEELRTEFQIYANDLEKGLALLSGLGNLSPIVGFLGTVVGMISAFAAIASASTVNAKVVASGIQVALITTAGGLIVAAPTLAFYYLFQHVIQSQYTKSELIIARLCEKLPRLTDGDLKGGN